MNFVRVDGFPSYVIHPCGTILRIYKNKTKEMKPSKQNGYMRVSLYKDVKRKTFYIHRLLALHFIPNPENKPCIDHINGIRDDNRLENLRWVTNKENMNGFRTPRPVSIITKGGITKRNNSWEWKYLMSGKQKTKTMKSKDALEKYRDETIKKYLN
tara:strand:+ start:253 stop:720 length:468 start_codon:yes stop_codon:yes gene_type:complete